MKLLQAIGPLLGKTLLVTAAVVVGFSPGGALGLPSWLHGICLAPAGYLFYRLSGETPPSWWKIVGVLLLITILTSIGGSTINSPLTVLLVGLLYYLTWRFFPSLVQDKEAELIIPPDA